MSSLVSEFLINPVLRQARRFSEVSRSTLGGSGDDRTAPTEAVAHSDHDTDDAHHHSDDGRSDAGGVGDMSTYTRPLSSSTVDTRVDEVGDEAPRDHLGFPVTAATKPGRGIPEDDGMRSLRSRIQEINARNVPQSAKARLMHDLLLERYRASKGSTAQVLDEVKESPLAQLWEPSTSPSGAIETLKYWQNQLLANDPAEKFVLSESDKQPTYAPIRRVKGPSLGASVDLSLAGDSESPPPPAATHSPDMQVAPLGCQHYERNVKLQCSTCKKWYTCRFCHDAVEDHTLIRKETKNMLCMLCKTPQRAGDMCINCGEISAYYYCDICKLWENRQSKPIYHCADCGICRRGLGLGKDYFHCKICSACIPTSIESSHKCIERSTDCDCPICGEYMFDSPKAVVFMPCGHSIHRKCYDQHMRVSYKCPICNKSLANMETQFRNLDVMIQGQPMPPEFRDTKALVLCNDCQGKCTVPYHWLGLKCSICRSYNTVEMQILGGDTPVVQAAAGNVPTDTTLTAQNDLAIDPMPANPATAVPTTGGTTSTREPTAIPNRRRHSSHGVEAMHNMPDRYGRSLSTYTGTSARMPHLALDPDSEDDSHGFWGLQSDGAADQDEESDSGDDSAMSDVEEEEEEDEEEEDELFLLGHR